MTEQNINAENINEETVKDETITVEDLRADACLLYTSPSPRDS